MKHDFLTFRSVVQGGFVLTGVLLVLLYIAFQARFLITGPGITLNEDPSMRQNERIVTLSGSATNISHLWLNGRSIYTDPKGNFATDVVLENGYTVTTLEAEDRYGRRTSLTQEFVYTPMSFTYNQ